MFRTEQEPEQRKEWNVERLVEALENGEIDNIEDLTAEEIVLLTSRAHPEESFEDLFDRLRQASAGDRDR